jgi:hypothetical protein
MNLLLIAAAVVLLVIVGAVLVRAIGGNITILDHWKQAWKFYSTWFLLLLAESPNIWNAAIAAGVFDVEAVPGEFAWMTRIASLGTFIVLYIKQLSKRPDIPEWIEK